jgi:hypothetical protein
VRHGSSDNENRRDPEWLAGLKDNERECADAALRLLRLYIDPAEATGICYRLMFFLHLYLTREDIAPIL